MLWEQSVGFSSQLHSYTDVIRIWAIETDHDKGNSFVRESYYTVVESLAVYIVTSSFVVFI